MSTRGHALTEALAAESVYRASVERALQARVKREDDLEDSITDATSVSATDLSTHIADTTTHGISAFGATLVDDGSAAAARTTLGAAASGAVTSSGLTMATARLLGRTSASSGAVEEITVGSGLSLAAGSLTNTVSSGAPTGAQYVTLATDATLTAERVLTEGTGIDIVDSGAGAAVTISVDLTETTRWETVREIDFNGWADTDFAAGGDTTYSLNDGSGALTWLVDASANANAAGAGTANCGFFRKNAADVGDDGSSGLRIAHDTGTSTTLSSSTTPGGGSGPPRISVLLTDLVSGYTPTDEYRLEIHITRLLDRATAPTNAGIHISVGAPTGSPTGATPARLGSAAMQRNGANEGGPTVNTSTGSAMKITDAAYAFTNGAAGSTRNDVIALQIRAGNAVTAYTAGPYSGGWPAETAYRCCGTGLASTLSTTAASDVMCRGTYVTIAADSRAATAGCVDFMVRRMRVLRRLR